MARKYVRDNRGRFASGGGGATARGGRLKTASGNKRATQTMKAAGAGGVIKGRTARTVAGEKVMAKLGKRAPAAKRISAARPGGTLKYRRNLAPTKEIASQAKKINQLKKMEFEGPSAANGWASRGGAATKGLANIEAGTRRLLRSQREQDYERRMRVSRANANFERDRSIRTGALSGKRVSFRSPAEASKAYRNKVAGQLATKKTYGENKRSHGIRRTKVGTQLSIIGRAKPIMASKKISSSYRDSDVKYGLTRRGRARLRNS